MKKNKEHQSEFNPFKEVMTTEDVAAYTGYQLSYIYKLCSQRKIPHFNPEGGRRVFFCLDEIKKWLTKNRVKTIDEII